ncbi:MAG: DUF1302 family protein [Pseudomonadota bacterium]
MIAIGFRGRASARALSLALLPGLLLVSATAPRAEVSLDGSFRFGYGTRERELMEGSAQLELRGDHDINDSLAVVGSVRARIQSIDLLEPGTPAYDTYSDASRPWTPSSQVTVELRDFFVEWRPGEQRFIVGKQQVVWGNLDGLRVLDQMNPHSFREFILADFDESRINLWSVYGDLSLLGFRAELLWNPDTTVHDIPEAGAWFELTAPRFRYGADPDAPGLPVRTDLPQDFEDGTIGGRLSRRVGGTELRLQAQTGLDYEPLGRVIIDDGQPVLERYYERREIYGASLETAFGGYVLRGELSAQPKRFLPVLTDGRPDAATGDQWTAALGLDVDAPFDTFLNVQYVFDRIEKAPEGLIRNKTDHIVTATLRRSFAYEALAVEARWYGNLEDNDGLARLILRYTMDGGATLGLSGDYFYGQVEGIFGQFKERDRITLFVDFRI